MKASVKAGLGVLVKRWIAVQTVLQYPVNLAYARVITVNGHKTRFIFGNYYCVGKLDFSVG